METITKKQTESNDWMNAQEVFDTFGSKHPELSLFDDYLDWWSEIQGFVIATHKNKSYLHTVDVKTQYPEVKKPSKASKKDTKKKDTKPNAEAVKIIDKYKEERKEHIDKIVQAYQDEAESDTPETRNLINNLKKRIIEIEQHFLDILIDPETPKSTELRDKVITMKAQNREILAQLDKFEEKKKAVALAVEQADAFTAMLKDKEGLNLPKELFKPIHPDVKKKISKK